MNLRYQNLIEPMTLEEKVSLLSGADSWSTTGISRLNIPSISFAGGALGLTKPSGKKTYLGVSKKSLPATCFPAASMLASSWNPRLMERVGRAIGLEAAANDVRVLLGPRLNIVRDPLAGGAFESFSEDPLLSGKMAAGFVRGVQSTGVAAAVRSYAVNSQETLRMSINEVVDERTLREIYLEGFRYVIEESRPKALMSAYNKIDGTYANEHPYLISHVLLNEWQYKGVILTEWGGVHSSVLGLKAGSVLEMPSSSGLSDVEITSAVKTDVIKQDLINERLDTLLDLVSTETPETKYHPKINFDEHHKLAVEATGESIVLLKNEDNVLPLAKNSRVAVIGSFAKKPRYQGSVEFLANPTQLTTALGAIKSDESLKFIGYEPGFYRNGKKSPRLVERAVKLAAQADVALVFLGLDESKEVEGSDRNSMSLSLNQLTLMEELKKNPTKIVVVLSGGSPVEMPFADSIESIVHGFIGGQGGGQALADVLTGRTNPSGKLTVSYPVKYADTPTSNYFPGKEATAEHREGLYVGYRYYATTDTPVLYPFGHGLSFTNFVYSDLDANQYGARLTVTNTGDVTGSEVVQIYVRPVKPSVYRPKRELKGFAKVYLEPGASKIVDIPLDNHAFAYFSPTRKQWVTDAGQYYIEAAASSQDVRLDSLVSVGGEHILSDLSIHLPTYLLGNVKSVPDEEFAKLLGRVMPANKWIRSAPITYEDTVAQLEYGKSISGRAFFYALKGAQFLLKAIGSWRLANKVNFIIGLPFSKIPRFTKNKITREKIEKYLNKKQPWL